MKLTLRDGTSIEGSPEELAHHIAEAIKTAAAAPAWWLGFYPWPYQYLQPFPVQTLPSLWPAVTTNVAAECTCGKQQAPGVGSYSACPVHSFTFLGTVGTLPATTS